jgi:hypothetical protein
MTARATFTEVGAPVLPPERASAFFDGQDLGPRMASLGAIGGRGKSR